MSKSKTASEDPGSGSSCLLTSSEPELFKSWVPAGAPHPEFLSNEDSSTVSRAIYFQLSTNLILKNAFLPSLVNAFAFFSLCCWPPDQALSSPRNTESLRCCFLPFIQSPLFSPLMHYLVLKTVGGESLQGRCQKNKLCLISLCREQP